MGLKITDQKYFAAERHLSEPHFDEEATLLSARRVVPLDDFPPQSRSRKRLGFGLVIVAAILVGAFGATLFYHQDSERQAAAIEDKGTPIAGGAGSAGSESQAMSGMNGAISNSPAQPVAEKVTGKPQNNSAVAQSSKAVSENKKSVPATYQRPKPISENESMPDSTGAESDEREMRRAERMEQRRLRRDARQEAKRETLERRRRASDEVLRIREIFEGSPRP